MVVRVEVAPEILRSLRSMAGFCECTVRGLGLRHSHIWNLELYLVLFLRLVPLFPFWLVNLVPAFLHVRTRTYVIGTFIGIIPGTAVFCSVGNGLGTVFEAGDEIVLRDIIMKPEILAPIIGLAVLSLVPIIYKKMKTSDS